jgi:hypothetical protein
MVVFIICKKKQQLKKERDYQETDTPRPILIILTSSNFPKLLIHTHFPIHLCPDPTQQKNWDGESKTCNSSSRISRSKWDPYLKIKKEHRYMMLIKKGKKVSLHHELMYIGISLVLYNDSNPIYTCTRGKKYTKNPWRNTIIKKTIIHGPDDFPPGTFFYERSIMIQIVHQCSNKREQITVPHSPQRQEQMKHSLPQPYSNMMCQRVLLFTSKLDTEAAEADGKGLKCW